VRSPESISHLFCFLATPFRDVLRGREPVGRAQACVDAGAVQVGADVTKVVPASAENASDVEATPAVGPLPEEPAAAAGGPEGNTAKLEGCKRGRQKKAESDGKMEAKPRVGKRQK
jgi:hypothetical protein